MRMRRGLIALVACACGFAALAPGALADKQVSAQPVDSYSGDVTMDQGETLTFTNNDLQNHDVTANDKGSDGRPLFASATIGTGQTSKVEGAQYLTTGSYKFFCTVHPFMTATLTVTSNGTPAPRPGSGGGGGGSTGGGGGSSDTTAPTVGLALGKVKLSSVRKHRKLPVKVTVSEASAVTLTATAGKKKIATGKATLSAAGSKSVSLSLTPAGRKALKGKHSVKVQLKAVGEDSAGNKGATSMTAKLRG
jgi:plastocyanin